MKNPIHLPPQRRAEPPRKGAVIQVSNPSLRALGVLSSRGSSPHHGVIPTCRNTDHRFPCQHLPDLREIPRTRVTKTGSFQEISHGRSQNRTRRSPYQVLGFASLSAKVACHFESSTHRLRTGPHLDHCAPRGCGAPPALPGSGSWDTNAHHN